MSRSRHTLVLSRYSLSPVRYSRRATATSLHGTCTPRSFLKDRVTSAMPVMCREAEQSQITSSNLVPRRVLGLCSPRAQRMASATLDLPQPFGPSMQVTPGKTFTSVFSANDLKPWIRIDSSRMTAHPEGVSHY